MLLLTALLLALPAHASETLEASAEYETASNATVPGIDQKLTLEGAWQPAPAWSLGAKVEATNPAPAAGDLPGLRDGRLTLTRELGGGITAGALTVLPSDREERRHGMTAAPGAIVAVQAEPYPGLKATIETTVARFLRGPAEELAEFDRWRVENELTLAYPLWGPLSLRGTIDHLYAWKWEGARESRLTLEQMLAYALGSWEIALGHRSETKLLGADGARAAPALFRPGKSSVFATLGWAL